MATQAQTNYIKDLAVIKTKEFKEVKELLHKYEIVERGSEVVENAGTLAAICDALTDLQASRLIDVLIQAKAPARERRYADSRVNKTIAELDSIKATIDNWDFS